MVRSSSWQNEFVNIFIQGGLLIKAEQLKAGAYYGLLSKVNKFLSLLNWKCPISDGPKKSLIMGKELSVKARAILAKYVQLRLQGSALQDSTKRRYD